MKMITKRVLLLILSVCLLAGMFVSCSQNGNEEPTDTESNEENTLPLEEDWVYEIPEELDYGGVEINILTWSGTDEWIFDATVESSPIDYQTFLHYCNVEEELGVVFNIAKNLSGGWGQHENFIAELERSQKAGDSVYDLVCQYSLSGAIGALRGVYTNLNELDYLTWKNPYWSDDLVDANTINGKIFYVTGDMSRSVLYRMACMVFNRDQVEANGYSDSQLYGLVDEGQWTLEKVREICLDVYEDLDGDGTEDTSDRYGLVVDEKNAIDFWQYGAGLCLLVKNEDGELLFNEAVTGDRGVTLCEKLDTLFYNTKGVWCISPTNSETFSNAFVNNQAMFSVVLGRTFVVSLQPSGMNYGILPMPKYDAEQKNYHTALSMVYSMFSVPIDAKDPDMSAAVMEALGCNGYLHLTPYIFETCMKSRYSQTPDDARMLDLVRAGIIYEPGRIFTNVDVAALVRSAVYSSESLVTKYKQRENFINTQLEEINFGFS